jgi:hypothetical protein
MTGVDGFFIDSLCATHFHRCFNPAHNHPHPDVWNWGVRRLLARVREEVDKVNPETLLLVEGAGDLAREFADGSICHSHDWTREHLTVPLLRFMHPDMRSYESWRPHPAKGGKPVGQKPERFHPLNTWNAVHGQRIYVGKHNAGMEQEAQRVRRYYDAFPEICDAPLSEQGVECEGGDAELFESKARVLTAGNLEDTPADVTIRLPVPAGVLFDRVEGLRVPVMDGVARLDMQPHKFRAFEVRP